MQVRTLPVAIALSLAAAFPSYALTYGPADRDTATATAAPLPFIAQRGSLPMMGSSITLETYLAQAMGLFRSIDRDGNGSISRADAQWMIENPARERRQARLQTFVRFDLNGDAKVTRQEADTASKPNLPPGANMDNRFGEHMEASARRQVSDFMAQDENGDGFVTYEEATKPSPEDRAQEQKMKAAVESVFAAAPDGSGTVSAADLYEAAVKAFRKLDRDGNLILTRDELLQTPQSAPGRPDRY